MNLYQPTISGSLVVSGSVSVIGPFTMSGGSITGTASFASNSGLLSNLDSSSFVGTGSFNTMSSSVSTRVTKIEGNYATTGSNIFTGAQTVCANITSTGTIIAQTLNVQQVTSSIVYSSGSNVFGCSLSNTQQFTGSVTMTGSLNVVGNTCFAGMSIHTTCVGIGTANPTDLLHLSSSATTGTAIKIQNADTGGKAWALISNGSLSGGGAGGFSIYDANTTATRLFISSSGNLGIGTVNPNYLLDTCTACVTAARFRGASTDATIVRIENTTSTQTYSIGAAGCANLGGAPNNSFYVRDETAGAVRLAISSTGAATFCSSVTSADNFNITTNGKAFQWTNSGNFVAMDANAGVWKVYTGTTGYNTRLTIDGTGVACFACQVCGPIFLATSCIGIGTTTPQAPFHICTVNITAQVRVESACDQAGVRLIAGVPGTARASRIDFLNGATCVGRPQWTIINDYNQNGTNDLRFVNCDPLTTVLTVLQNGNVGIGTTSPSTLYPLTLNGDSSTKTGGIVFRQSGTDTFYAGNPSVSNTTDFELWNPRNGYLRLATNNVERLRITSTGEACFACQVCAPTIVTPGLTMTGNYNCSTTVCSSYNNTWVTIIPTNTLGTNSSYVVKAAVNNMGANPYEVGTAIVFAPVNTNAQSSFDNELLGLMSTHQGYGATLNLIYFRTIAGSGQVSAGLQIKLCNFTTLAGTLNIKASQLTYA